MRFRHPRGLTIAIDVGGETVLPDEGGVYEIDRGRGWLREFARAHDTTADELLVDGDDDDDDDGDDDRGEASATCETVKTDGEVCGRELPCPYHSEAE